MASRSNGKRTTPRDMPRRGLEPEMPDPLIQTRLGIAYLADSVDFFRNRHRMP